MSVLKWKRGPGSDLEELPISRRQEDEENTKKLWEGSFLEVSK